MTLRPALYGFMRRASAAALRALLVLIGAALLAGAAAVPAPFDPTRDAAADLAAALVEARGEGKRVLVDVGGEWCSWCHVMDAFFATEPEARAARDHNYVWLKINWSPQNRNAAVLSRWPRITGYPHLFVLAPDGSLLHSQDTGALEAGEGYDRTRVLDFLERWRP